MRTSIEHSSVEPTGVEHSKASKSIAIAVAGLIAGAISGVALTFSASPLAAQQRTLCVHGLEAPQALTVRDGPGTSSRVIGRFPAKACGVRLAGRCSGDWCQMALGNTKGWVDTRHIGVYELPKAATATAPAAPASPAPDKPATPLAAPKRAPPADAAAADAAPQDNLASAQAAPAPRTARRVNGSSRKSGPRMAARPAGTGNDSRNDDDDADADASACVTNVDRDDTLRIRTGPGVDHDEIGDLPPRACGVAISERCRGNWCRITWRGRRGWVNTNYLD